MSSSNNNNIKLPPCSVMLRDDQLNPLSLAAMAGGPQVSFHLKIVQAMPGMANNPLFFTEYLNRRQEGDETTGGYTALHYACQSGKPDSVQVLLEAGANPNVQKNNGATPLITACASAGHASKNQLPAYAKCVKYILDSPLFDLELNDSTTLETSRISPLWICVNREYFEADALLPLLQTLLEKGFDPNGTHHNMSALHLALFHHHTECALCLVRAGASLKAQGRKMMEDVDEVYGTWSALEASKAHCGEAFTRKLVEASVAAAAVASSGSRSRAKKAAAIQGDLKKLSKLANKAKDAGDAFIQAGRWLNAMGAYQEALSYPKEALDIDDRYSCLVNLTACFCQLGQGKDAVANARQLCQEYPNNPSALYALGNAMQHPSNGELSEEVVDEIVEITDKIQQLLRDNPVGEPLWFLGFPREQLLAMSTRLRDYANRQREPKSPAILAAQVALEEFNNFGNMVKAANAVNEALKPENKHPNPFAFKMLRGSIYYQWGKELLDSITAGDKNDSHLPVSERLHVDGEGSRLQQARAKFEIALEQFAHCASEAHKYVFPAWTPVWNESLAHIVLGNFDDGWARCVQAMRMRHEDEMENVGIQTPGAKETKVASNSRGNEDFIRHIDEAFRMARVVTSQQALEDTKVEEASSDCRADVGSDASSILQKAVALELLDQSSAEELIFKIDSRALGAESVRWIWTRAVETEESALAAYVGLRAAVAESLVAFTASVKENMTSVSSRVLGTILSEALEWNPDVHIPNELSKASKAVQSKECGHCGASNPAKSCPCGKAHYCDRDCQRKAWFEHKKVHTS